MSGSQLLSNTYEEVKIMKKWEYKILDIEKVFYTVQAEERITKLLNELGQEGWELIGYATFKLHKYVLKRPIE